MTAVLQRLNHIALDQLRGQGSCGALRADLIKAQLPAALRRFGLRWRRFHAIGKPRW